MMMNYDVSTTEVHSVQRDAANMKMNDVQGRVWMEVFMAYLK
jgi:hypothetical protein